MAPEQAEFNALDVDTRADVYALGVILYELLTGTTPVEKQAFRKAAWDEIRRVIKEEEPPRRAPAERRTPASPPSRRGGRWSRKSWRVGARRSRLDRDEGVGEGTRPALRVGQRLRRRRGAVT